MNPTTTPSRSARKSTNASGSSTTWVMLYLCACSMLLLPESLQAQTTSSQTSTGCATSVCNSAINLGNFGVDADLNANEPGSLSGTNDDWFDSPNLPGPGIGVIGTTNATSVPAGLSAADFDALVQASPTRNLTYVQRMAYPSLYPRLITATTGHLLLDAVAARDNHSAGTSSDSTAFGSGSKNGANPGNWNLIVAGVPQKNDLIDVGGHLRRAFDFANNIPGALLGYAFATTRNTSGDSHVDFEIFRTDPKIIAGKLTNTGPDSGHTTTKFVPGGLSLQQPGDVLVSVDYANGGNNPCASVRVWVNPSNVDGNNMDTATYNALPAASRIYTFTGTFSSDNSTAPYGYAEIRPKNGFTGCLFASVTNKTTTPAAGPWGNLSSQNAGYSANIEQLQMVEVAIDFSAFGLDIDPQSGPCFNLFGSLLIKTRSSTSFTAAMKDFAGPFIFGNFQEVNANAGEDKNLACSVTAINLDGSSTTPGASFQWTVVPGSGGHIVSGANTATPLVDSAGTYVLTVSNPALATCVAIDTVIVSGTPDVTPPTATCPPAVERNCIDELPLYPSTLAEFIAQGGSAFDISGVINIVAVDSPLVGGSCGGTVTRYFTLTDECGNASTCTQIITVNDDVPPIISAGPADLTLGCNPSIPAANITLISATDNCTGVTISVLPDNIIGTCNRTLERTYLATDGCGNTATFVQTITYKVDNQAPAFTHSDPAVQNGSTQDIGCNPTPTQINNAFGTASASDNCDASVDVFISTGNVQSNGCLRSQTTTWSAADSCGNNAVSFTRTITWKEDLTAPAITATGSVANNSDLGCNPTPQDIDAALGTATVADACDNLTATESTDAVINNGCLRSQTRRWNVTDLCNNVAAEVTRTITWKVDLTAPVITATGSVSNNSDLGCNPTPQAIDAALGSATVSDACDNLTATLTNDPVVSNGCMRSQTRRWNVTDLCSNNATEVTRTISWKVDTQAPVISATGSVANNTNLGCNPTPTQIDAALGTATASDNCDNVTPTVTTAAVISTGCNRSQTRTWNAVDQCGNNASTVTRTITWKVDLTAPVITATGSVANNADLGCNPTPQVIDAALGTSTVADACDNLTATVSTDAVVSNGCNRSQTRRWNVTDQCGNPATEVTRTITWKVDLTAPVITASGSVANNADLGCNPTPTQIDAALGTATVADACDNLTAIANTSGVIINGCQRSQTRTWTVTDACGNPAAPVNRTINWKVDTAAPVITATGSIANNGNLGCNPSPAAINAALGTATATDNCDNVTPTATTAGVVSNGCNRSQTRSWTAIDLCGNTATTVTRTISWKEDLTAPVITATGSVANNGDLGCNPSPAAINAALGTATATDNCDNVTPTATTAGVVSNGCNRSQTRSWTAVDLCGNTATTATRTITWKEDLTAPVITATGSVANNSDLGCNASPATINAALGTATASDNCDNVTPTVSTGSVVSSGCTRTQTRTWNAVDLCNNNAAAVTRTITWKVDTVAAVITATGSVPNNSDLGCNPTPTLIDGALGTATATDGCGGTITPTPTTGNVVSNGCNRSQTRTWTAVDPCGNTSTTVSRTITWKVDLTAPVITATGSVPNNSDIGCNPSPAAINAALGTATAADNCDNVTPTVSTSNVTSNGCTRTQTRTWNAVDLCGNNAAVVTRTISWKEDLTAPVITATGSIANNADLGCNPSAAAINAALGTATASDNCDNVTPTATTAGVVSNGCNRSQTRSWTAVDLCGNTATTVTRTITWKEDLSAPVVTCSVNGNLTVCAGDQVNFTSSATDNCDGNLPTICTRSDGQPLASAYPIGTTTVTCSATDVCGNTGTCSFTVTVLASPTCSLTAPAVEPLCGSSGNTLTATTTNATSYSWSVTTTDPLGTPWVITGGANSPSITYTAGSGEATFTLSVTNSLNGVNCNNQCQVTFSCQGSRFCTYTQGYYGNRGGMSCAGVRTSGFLNILLGSGPLVTGIAANNRSLTLTTADVTNQCIYDKLPGGGTATIIPTGNHTCTTVPMSMLRSNGSLKNILLAQTITLGLNLRVPASALGGLRITGKYLLTYASSGSGCNNPLATAIPGTGQVKLIPGPVVNYLGVNNTVADLLSLANQALGGTLPAGAPGLSAISNAVAAFNEAFDECRFFGGFFNTDPLATLSTTTRVLETSDLMGAIAFPNPAADRVNIEFALNGFDSDVIVEVFDLNGARVAELFNANAEADVAYRTQWDAATVQPGVYFYRVNTSRGNHTGKITIVR